MTEPIKPSEAMQLKSARIPDFVIEAFNNVIAHNFDGRRSYFKEDAVISAILNHPKAAGMTRKGVYEAKLLDVEEIFRGAGWSVVYDAPGYCESYDPTFEFKLRSDR